MNAIIEDLLTLSRIESEKESADALLTDEAILPVVESAVQLCHVLAQRKNVRINIEVDATLRGRVNAALLEQGVLNLVDNAVKYSEQGAEVWVRGERSGDELRLSVVDAGAGIAAEHLARVFERFYRVDKARSREVGGTGLGLAIVKHIAQAHGGRVTVDSQLGQGSTFTLHLPLGQEVVAEPEAIS
jgi:two-component system phosphate regulon sensor histidine kinase PhoR